MISPIKIDPAQHGPAGLRTFLNIAELWELSVEEQMVILGITDRATFDDWKVRVRALETVILPMYVVERIGCMLSIYGSLVTLHTHEGAGCWIRSPNASSAFEGKSALEKITTGELQDLKTVVRHLLAEIYGR